MTLRMLSVSVAVIVTIFPLSVTFANIVDGFQKIKPGEYVL